MRPIPEGPPNVRASHPRNSTQRKHSARVETWTCERRRPKVGLSYLNDVDVIVCGANQHWGPW
jgi:hypothetical protein